MLDKADSDYQLITFHRFSDVLEVLNRDKPVKVESFVTFVHPCLFICLDQSQTKPNMLRDEFMLNMNKFVQQIRNGFHHL